MESWQFKSRKTDSNYWQHDKQTLDAERSLMALICSSKCICNEYIRVYSTTRIIPFELVFARKPRQLTSFELPKITSFPVEYREFFRLLLDRAKMYRDMDMEWRTLQALELREKNKKLTNIENFHPNDLVYLASHLIHLHYSLKPKSLGKITLAHWPLILNWMIRIIC